MTTSKVISCIIVDDEAIAREVIATHLAKSPNVNIVGSFGSAIEAFNCLLEHKIDLIFLDINMPEISGISFAKSINKDIKVIFTTAYRDYAVEGFELQAVDYLLKPISLERLLKAVNHYVELHEQLETSEPPKEAAIDFMFVRSERRMVQVGFDTICFVESYSDYIKIHRENDTVVTRQTISAIEAKLPADQFIRIHRSFIVAIKSIKSFTNEEIVVSNQSLSISRSYRKEVLAKLESF